MASLVATDDVGRYCPILRGKIHICLKKLLIDTCVPDLLKGGLAFALFDHACTEAACDGFRLSGKQQLSGSLRSGAT